jgi:hypothetical protein
MVFSGFCFCEFIKHGYVNGMEEWCFSYYLRSRGGLADVFSRFPVTGGAVIPKNGCNAGW